MLVYVYFYKTIPALLLVIHAQSTVSTTIYCLIVLRAL